MLNNEGKQIVDTYAGRKNSCPQLQILFSIVMPYAVAMVNMLRGE
jgi:hypothetical protein